MRQPTGDQSVRTSGYDFPELCAAVNAAGYDLEYLPETTTTMQDARAFGLRRTVVLADHQSQGRGRYGRSWLDVPGQSVLMTLVEPWGEAGDPPPDSLLPQQLFVLAGCVALQELTGSTELQVRWPNDLTAHGKKLGGILIENLNRHGRVPYPMLFGIGINVHGDADRAFPETDYGAISLDQATGSNSLTRQEIVAAIVRKWSLMRVDLGLMQNSGIFEHYSRLWQQNASLQDQIVSISGLGRTRDRTVEGRAFDFPLGQGVVLETSEGIEEVREFHTESVVKVME
ncbi:MAG: biotin--[acetyl-CoA-carboxylase] ligase [Patescibacteria group bacterium]